MSAGVSARATSARAAREATSAAAANDAKPSHVVRARRSLLAGATLVFVSTFFWQLAGFVYNAVGAHALGPTRYGALSATIGLLALLAPVMMAMQAMASREVTTIARRGVPGELAASVWHYGVRLCCGTALLAGILAALATPLTRIFHLGNPWGVRLAAVCVLMYLPSHYLSGVLQGQEQFGRFALQTGLEAVAKIAFAALLMGVWWAEPTGGMVALAASATIGLVINAVLVREFAPRLPRLTAPVRVSPGYSLTAIATFGLLALLLSADTLVGKHYLPGRAAGLYAGVSLTGKIVFFATSALSIILFPVFSRHQDAGSDATRSLGAAIAVAVTIIAGSLVVLWGAPRAVVTGLLGGSYRSIATDVAPMGAAFGGYALAYLLATYLLARRQTGVVAALAVAVGVQLGGFYAFHASIRDMIAVEAAAFATAVAGCLVVAMAPSRQRKPAPAAARRAHPSIARLDLPPTADSALRAAKTET